MVLNGSISVYITADADADGDEDEPPPASNDDASAVHNTRGELGACVRTLGTLNPLVLN